jgi:hypothetical protein
MFKPPISKDILPSQTEEEEDRTRLLALANLLPGWLRC